MTRLVTQRLILRAGQDRDLDPLFSVYSNSDAMRYWSTPPHDSRKTTQKLLNGLVKPGPRMYFVIEYEDVAIGTCGIHQGTEIGFIIDPKHWRKGIVSEAANAIICHMWKTTDCTELTGDIDPRNEASAGILRSLGFIKSGYEKNTFYIDGEWSDSAYYELKRPTQ